MDSTNVLELQKSSLYPFLDFVAGRIEEDRGTSVLSKWEKIHDYITNPKKL